MSFEDEVSVEEKVGEEDVGGVLVAVGGGDGGRWWWI